MVLSVAYLNRKYDSRYCEQILRSDTYNGKSRMYRSACDSAIKIPSADGGNTCGGITESAPEGDPMFVAEMH